MGFIAFCIMTWFIGVIAWGAIKSSDERQKLIDEFSKAPAQSLFVLTWVGCIYLFAIGILAPMFGRAEFFNSGWEIWQIGGVGALVGFVVNWWWKIG
jgi:hypothetical protein